MALYTRGRPAADPAAARVRAGRALAPAAPRPPLRRRAHRLVPLLLAARGRRCCDRSGAIELVVDWLEVWSRAYWREYLGRIGGRVGVRWSSGCARALPQRAFCFSRAARRAAARGGAARRGDGAARAVRRLARRRPVARPAEPLVVFAGRHDPREARARRRRRGGAGRAGGSRGCGASSSATGPSARRCSRAIAAHGARQSVVGSRASWRPRGRRGAAQRAVHAAALPARGLRHGRRRGSRARHAQRRRGRRGQRRHRADRARASTASSSRARDAQADRRRDRARARGGHGAAREHGALVRRATPSRCRWSARCRPCSTATNAPPARGRSSPASAARCAAR